jgi:BNR repeat-like domain
MLGNVRRRALVFAGSMLVATAASAVVLPSNTLVNNPNADATNQDAQAMCAIARVNASTLVAAFLDTGSYLGVAKKFTGYSRSTDNGATWTDLGVLPTSAYGDLADARLAVQASSGAVFLATLPFSVSNAVPVFKSTDGGVTFAAPVNAAQGSSLTDIPSLAIDNFPASPFYGRIYVAYTEFGAAPYRLKLSQSTDGGATWASSSNFGTANASQGSNLVVLPNGTLDGFHFTQGSPSSIAVSRSTDGGSTWSGPFTVAALSVAATNGDLGFPYRTNAFPRAAVNPANGNVYVVYNDDLFDPGDIFFRRSTDGGVTWGFATKLNDDATTHAQFHPAIAVTPDGTHLMVAWYDRRSDASDVQLEYWGVRGTVGSGVTFGANFPISNTMWSPVYGVDPALNAKIMTDYDEMTADNNAFDVVWSDGRDTAPVSMRKNQNVRYARVTASSLRGDVNGDSARDLVDIFALINSLFASGPPPVSTCHGDANHSGAVDIADVFFLINFLFASGPAPLPPC